MRIDAHIITDPDHTGRWIALVGSPDGEPLPYAFSSAGDAVKAVAKWADDRGMAVESFTMQLTRFAPAWHCEAETTGLQTDPCSAENPIHGPPCGVDQTKPDVDVCKDVRGVWWVTLDGVKVSDHRTHDAARIAARRHQVELMSK